MNLCRFIGAYLAQESTLPIHLVFTGQDKNNYAGVVLPKGFTHSTVPESTRLGPLLNLIFKEFPNESFYGFMADDIIPSSRNWDTILAEACQPNKIAWGSDGIQNENLPTHAFIGGDLIRNLGWWVAPGIQHWFMDNIWKDLANTLNVGVYLPEVKTTHYHVINGKAPNDSTYINQPDTKIDEATYLKFRKDLDEATISGRSILSKEYNSFRPELH